MEPEETVQIHDASTGEITFRPETSEEREERAAALPPDHWILDHKE